MGDNSIVWSKSIMNTKCRICRKKTDSDKMLLCDACDRGHHIYCLKPKLKSIPTGDWFCPDCKPKERTRSPKKKIRRVFSSTEDDTEEDVDTANEEEEVATGKRGSRNKKNESNGGKKGKLSNLLGKRQAAGKGEAKRRNDNETEDDEDEEEESPGRRPKRKNKSEAFEENKENARGKRRRDDDDEDFAVVYLDDLLKELMRHDDGWAFDRPITKQDAPDYHLYIKTPMDLQTIRTRLNGMSHYDKNQEVIDDVKLVFSNCYQYNQDYAEEYKCAERLEKYFKGELKKQGIIDEKPSTKRKKT